MKNSVLQVGIWEQNRVCLSTADFLSEEHSGSRDQRNGPGARKEQRKASRAQKKTRALHSEARISKKDSCAKSRSSIERIIPSADLEKRPRNVHLISELAAEGSRNPKSTVKKPKPLLVSLRDSKRDSSSSLAPPTPTLARGTKSPFLADDAEIAALEKALGVRGNKSLPKSFTKDGLDSLLDGLEDPQLEKIASKSKRDRIEGDEWLAKKRQKGTDGHSNPHLVGKNEFLGNENPSKNCISDETLSNTDGDDETDSSNLSREQSRESPIRATRENPYKAPIAISNSQEPRKYLPPSLRNREMLGYEDLSHLRRQIQGLLNRLSGSNIISILEDVENLYQSNSRQHVSTVLLDLLMGLLCDDTSLQDTFIILHAGFIAAIYKIIGTDFGAQVIQRIDEEFMIHYQSEAIGDTTSKRSTNLIGLLAELYNYQVIDNTLIIDFIRLFIDDFTESSAELIMKVMRSEFAIIMLGDVVVLNRDHRF